MHTDYTDEDIQKVLQIPLFWLQVVPVLSWWLARSICKAIWGTQLTASPYFRKSWDYENLVFRSEINLDSGIPLYKWDQIGLCFFTSEINLDCATNFTTEISFDFATILDQQDQFQLCFYTLQMRSIQTVLLHSTIYEISLDSATTLYKLDLFGLC